MKSWFSFYAWMSLACCLAIGAVPRSARAAETLKPMLTPFELERMEGEAERLGGAYPGVILLDRERRNDADGKYGQPYRVALGVYAAERREGKTVGYNRRFLVRAPDREALPLAKRVARMLLLLHGANRDRTRFDHPRNEATLEVWLTRQAGAGLAADIAGEQFRNQIYLYNIYQERAPEEWAREVAHEYGHYALPGVSGYTAPEDWANGVLGERLFLCWLREDLRAGRLQAQDLPFVTPEQLDAHLAQGATLFMQRFAKEGFRESALAQRDAAGMDYFTAVALYFDALHGGRFLVEAFSYAESSRGDALRSAADYLRGAYKALREAPEIRVRVPQWARRGSVADLPIYLPQGVYAVSAAGKLRGWRFAADPKILARRPDGTWAMKRSGWMRLVVSLSEATSDAAEEEPSLRLLRAEK